MVTGTHLRKPDWLKVKIPSGQSFKEVFELLEKHKLSTVCHEARCPNMYECWNKKSATIMILGKVCTRACRFCAVKTGNPHGFTDPEEPNHVAEVIHSLGLRYVVITSVDRDDLTDNGSGHYALTIEAIRQKNPNTKIEALIPDFAGNKKLLKKIVDAHPFVIGHNVETVRRLTHSIRDRRCGYELSLAVLKNIKQMNSELFTKSGFMVGCGEERHEIIQTLHDLKDTGVDIVTIGQYLQPTRKHYAVMKYYTPQEFDELQGIGQTIGIKRVVSGPLVRSSYHAAEAVSESHDR